MRKLHNITVMDGASNTVVFRCGITIIMY